MTKPAGESCRWHVSQSRLGALLMPQGKCRRQGLWPRPHCVPPTLGGHHWEVTRCKEANNSLLNPGFGRDPRPSSACKGAPVHLGPHLPGVVLSGDPPPRSQTGLPAQLCTHRHSSGQRRLLETSLGKPSPGGGVKGVQGIKPRERRSAPTLTGSAFGASPTAHTSIFWNWKSSWADS